MLAGTAIVAMGILNFSFVRCFSESCLFGRDNEAVMRNSAVKAP